MGPGTTAVAVKLPSGATPRRRFLSDTATLSDLYTWVSFVLHDDVMLGGTARKSSAEVRRNEGPQRGGGEIAGEVESSGTDAAWLTSEQVPVTVSLTSTSAAAIWGLHRNPDTAWLCRPGFPYMLLEPYPRQVLARSIEAMGLTLAKAGVQNQVMLVIESDPSWKAISKGTCADESVDCDALTGHTIP